MKNEITCTDEIEKYLLHRQRRKWSFSMMKLINSIDRELQNMRVYVSHVSIDRLFRRVRTRLKSQGYTFVRIDKKSKEFYWKIV